MRKITLLLHLVIIPLHPNIYGYFVLHRLCGFSLGKGAEFF